MSKFEKDVLGAVGLVGSFLGRGNPAVEKVANEILAKGGHGPMSSDNHGDSVPDDGKTIDMRPDPSGNGFDMASEIFYCVFDGEDRYTAHAYTDPGAARDYSRRVPGSYIKKLRGSEIPEG